MGFTEIEQLISEKERYEKEIWEILEWGNWLKKDWTLEEDKELQKQRNIFFVKNREYKIALIDRQLEAYS